MAAANPSRQDDQPETQDVRTWRIPGLHVLEGMDLAGLITSGAIQGLAVMADGTVLFDAPDGPPPGLEDMIEPVPDALEDRLARIEASVTALRQEGETRERMEDRLEAVEYGLNERLAGIVAEETFNLFAEQEKAPETSVAERMDDLRGLLRAGEWREALARMEDRVAALAPPDPEALQRVENRLATLPEAQSLIAALSDRLEDFAARPVPQIDLTPQRQLNARILQAMSEAIRRLESTAEALPASLQPQLDALLQAIAAQGTRDLAPLLDAIARATPDMAPLTEADARILATLTELVARPEPKMDVSGLESRIAAIAEGIPALSVHLEDQLAVLQEAVTGHLPARVAALGEALAAPLDLSPILAEIQAMGARIDTSLAAFAQRLDALEARPAPVLDLTEQRKSFAAFGTALSRSLQRLEQAADRWETTLEPIAALNARLEAQASAPRDELAGAILSLAQRVSERESPRPADMDFARFRAAQQEFFQDLRFLLAEVVASQQRIVATPA